MTPSGSPKVQKIPGNSHIFQEIINNLKYSANPVRSSAKVPRKYANDSGKYANSPFNHNLPGARHHPGESHNIHKIGIVI